MKSVHKLMQNKKQIFRPNKFSLPYEMLIKSHHIKSKTKPSASYYVHSSEIKVKYSRTEQQKNGTLVPIIKMKLS